jgi:hypothetical protein
MFWHQSCRQGCAHAERSRFLAPLPDCRCPHSSRLARLLCPIEARHIAADCGLAADINPTRHIDWLKRYWATLEPHTDGFYSNDVVDESQKQVDENYLGNYPRLVRLKSQYDPTNLFRLNANVRPAG